MDVARWGGCKTFFGGDGVRLNVRCVVLVGCGGVMSTWLAVEAPAGLGFGGCQRDAQALATGRFECSRGLMLDGGDVLKDGGVGQHFGGHVFYNTILLHFRYGITRYFMTYLLRPRPLCHTGHTVSRKPVSLIH